MRCCADLHSNLEVLTLTVSEEWDAAFILACPLEKNHSHGDQSAVTCHVRRVHRHFINGKDNMVRRAAALTNNTKEGDVKKGTLNYFEPEKKKNIEHKRK